MILTITERNENKLLNRTEVKFEASHSGTSTPSRADILKKLSAELKVAEDLIVIDKLNTMHGQQTTSGVARVYENTERLAEVEAKFLVARGKPKEKEGEEEAPAEGEKKEAPAEKSTEGEAPIEGEKKEEKAEPPKEEKNEEVKEEKKDG